MDCNISCDSVAKMHVSCLLALLYEQQMLMQGSPIVMTLELTENILRLHHKAITER
jgi:hypothetical protein